MHYREMTIRDIQILEMWQSGSERCAETELDKLEEALKSLTELCEIREGAHIVRANRHRLKLALGKLYGLYADTTGPSDA